MPISLSYFKGEFYYSFPVGRLFAVGLRQILFYLLPAFKGLIIKNWSNSIVMLAHKGAICTTVRPQGFENPGSVTYHQFILGQIILPLDLNSFICKMKVIITPITTSLLGLLGKLTEIIRMAGTQ